MSVTSLMSVSSWTSKLRPLRNRLSSLDEESLDGLLKPSMRETGPPGAGWPSFWIRRKEGVSMEWPTRSKTAANSLKTAGVDFGVGLGGCGGRAGVGGAAAKDGGGGCIGSIDDGGVDESGGEIGLLARVADARAGGGVEEGAVEFDSLAGGVDVIAGGDGEVDQLCGAGVGAVGV